MFHRGREGRSLRALDPGRCWRPGSKTASELGIPFTPMGYPVEYLALGGIGPGVPVRATVSDFGPGYSRRCWTREREPKNRVWGSCSTTPTKKGLPLLDLSDLRALLTFLASDDGKNEAAGHRRTGVADRRCTAARIGGLGDGGGNELFGEPQFDVNDLLRTAQTAAASSRASSYREYKTSRSCFRPR